LRPIRDDDVVDHHLLVQKATLVAVEVDAGAGGFVEVRVAWRMAFRFLG